MAVNYQISNPRFSFVQFLPATLTVIPSLETIFWEVDSFDCCPQTVDFSLPIVEEDDLKFQVKIITHDPELACDILENPIKCELLLLRGCGNDESTIAANTIENFTNTYGFQFVVQITGVNEVTFYWKDPLRGLLSLIACNECFQLLFRFNVPGSEDNIHYISRCFIRKCSPCFFSILEYSCEEDSFNFRYCQFDVVPVNRVRLPFYLLKPQLITNREVYVKSDGSWLIPSSISKKEFSALVDFVPENIHEKLAIALEHDVVNVESERYTGGIRSNAAYNIDWLDDDDCIAQGNFKATATPFDARNNNCNECDPPDPNICTSVHACEVDVVADFEILWGPSNPYAHITWTNPSGDYPAGGYTVTPGSIVGGSIEWGLPVAVAFPDMFADIQHIIAGYGTFYAKITAICNDSTMHDTILEYTLGDTEPCEVDLDLSYTVVPRMDGGVSIEVRWPVPAAGIPVGGYRYQVGGSSGGVPDGVWGSLSTQDDYFIGSGMCGFNYGPSVGVHGERAFRVISYCNETTTHETIIIVTF